MIALSDLRRATLLLSLLTVFSLSYTSLGTAADVNEPRFDPQGNLLLPDEGYREWIYVGTPRYAK